MRLMIRATCIGILFLIAGNAKAQFLQFTPPGGPDGRPESAKERLERELSEAPYRVGPVRVAPLLGFRDVAYVRDLFSSGATESSDLTATVSAGFRAYLHTGPKITWIAQALPEYVWWQKEENARRLNLSGGVEGLFLFNRLTVDVAASRVEQQRIATPEIPELVNTASDLVRLDSELEVTSKLRPFVSARWARQEGLLDDRDDPRIEGIEQLDREEQVVRAGVRWYPRSGWTIGLGAESTQTEFERTALDSSNEGTAPVLELLIDRTRFFFRADLAARSLEATEGSRFVAFDGVTGNVSFNFLPRGRVEVWLYANRNLVYSIQPDYPYLDDQRIGLSLGSGLGKRLFGRVYVETGTEEYVAFLPTTPDRQDDLTAYGASLRFSFTNALALSVQASRIDLSSNLPGEDRSFTSGGLTLTLRGNMTGRNL